MSKKPLCETFGGLIIPLETGMPGGGAVLTVD